MFSRRLPDDLRPNVIARARLAAGPDLLDLTETNPTRCGLVYPESLATALADPEVLRYRPEPCGLETARHAVAREYHRRGVDVDPARVVLTASTSEAYSFLFKLLAEPGQAVLVPKPSYPLFDHLATLDGLEPRAYPLDPEAGWQPRPETTSTRDARACLVVQPNNPTGSHLNRERVAALDEWCAANGLALVVDEVFLDYPLDDDAPPSSLIGSRAALTFVLGGLSKSVGLPQMKLAWIVVCGPAAVVPDGIERLSYIADNYLSVCGPVQLALPELLELGASVRQAILDRCRRNLAHLSQAVVAESALELLRPRGGWTAVLRFPRVVDEQALVLQLLAQDRVAVHPGYFFDFPRDGHLVLSLLPEPAHFDEALGRVIGRLRDRIRAVR